VSTQPSTSQSEREAALGQAYVEYLMSRGASEIVARRGFDTDRKLESAALCRFAAGYDAGRAELDAIVENAYEWGRSWERSYRKAMDSKEELEEALGVLADEWKANASGPRLEGPGPTVLHVRSTLRVCAAQLERALLPKATEGDGDG